MNAQQDREKIRVHCPFRREAVVHRKLFTVTLLAITCTILSFISCSWGHKDWPSVTLGTAVTFLHFRLEDFVSELDKLIFGCRKCNHVSIRTPGWNYYRMARATWASSILGHIAPGISSIVAGWVKVRHGSLKYGSGATTATWILELFCIIWRSAMVCAQVRAWKYCIFTWNYTLGRHGSHGMKAQWSKVWRDVSETDNRTGSLLHDHTGKDIPSVRQLQDELQLARWLEIIRSEQ